MRGKQILIGAFMLITVSTRHFTPRRLEDATNPVTDPNTEDLTKKVEETLELLGFLGETISRLTHDNYDILGRLKKSTSQIGGEVRERANKFYEKFHHEVNKFGDFVDELHNSVKVDHY